MSLKNRYILEIEIHLVDIWYSKGLIKSWESKFGPSAILLNQKKQICTNRERIWGKTQKNVIAISLHKTRSRFLIKITEKHFTSFWQLIASIIRLKKALAKH